MRSAKVLHLIDDVSYVQRNCFQHQLMLAFQRSRHKVTTRSLNDLLWGRCFKDEYDVVVSCLKQRTLKQHIDVIAPRLMDVPISVYDQDPWESFKLNGPCTGAYDEIRRHLGNDVRFCVTTEWWADYLTKQGYSSTFVSMWMLPEYCTEKVDWEHRSTSVGFFGSLHPRRKRLVTVLEDSGISVRLGKESNYQNFLNLLSDTQIFVHSEDEGFLLQSGELANMSFGMLVKDIEAAARGCWSVRNHCDEGDPGSYLEEVETVRFYDDVKDAPDIINEIHQMDPEERQAHIDRTIRHVRSENRWRQTVERLVSASFEEQIGSSTEPLS